MAKKLQAPAHANCSSMALLHLHNLYDNLTKPEHTLMLMAPAREWQKTHKLTMLGYLRLYLHLLNQHANLTKLEHTTMPMISEIQYCHYK